MIPKKKQPSGRTTIVLAKPLTTRLRRAARELGLQQSSLMAVALDEWLTRHAR